MFTHVRRIKDLLKLHFPWAQVRYLAESMASMDRKDLQIMSKDFGNTPVKIEASGVSLARRPRLYWMDWEVSPGPGVRVHPQQDIGDAAFNEVELSAQVEPKDFLTPGCCKVSEEPFPTFTTSRPRTHPGRRPAGLDKLTEQEREAWEKDKFRFPPYQFSPSPSSRKQWALPDPKHPGKRNHHGIPKRLHHSMHGQATPRK